MPSEKKKLYYNRELSWMDFNARVLEEAQEKDNPIMERLNFLAITLAIIGTLGPVVGALVHHAGSVLVIANSALLLKWKLR